MDNLPELIPAKKRCTMLMNGGRLRPVEHVREFQLPRQYPDTMKQALKGGVNSMESTASNFTPPDDAVLSKTKSRIPYNLPKLRILSPGGRDLGEFNLKLRSDDPMKGNAIMITKSGINKSVTKLKLSPGSIRVLPRILKQGTKKIQKNNLIRVTEACSSVSWKDNNTLPHQPQLILPISRILSNNQGMEEIPLYKKSIESQYPANCKRLINYNNESNILLPRKNFKISKGKCIATIKNTENGKIVTSLKSVANLMPRSNQHDLSNNRKNFNNKVSYDRDNLLEVKPDPDSKSQVSEMKTQNIMTILPNNKVLLFNQNTGLMQEDGTPVEFTSESVTSVDHGTARNNMQSKDLKAGSQNDHFINDGSMQHISQLTDIDVKAQSNVQSKAISQKKLSTRLNIIRKAMDSVKDHELRELALKALADCGIGIEKYVPIRPPEAHKTVHDTQVQTTVFGLLDPKSFILINKDLDNMYRQNQITLHDMPGDQNLLANEPHSNNLVSKDSNVVEQEIPFDLDSLVEEFWKEESNTAKIKETLSVTNEKHNLLKSLQKDFESIKQYDQNGMLNIHNAVINNNSFLVQKQLVVLKYCKQSVDILTEDGVTSLELAIKYDACSGIVKLLLDAGAQPVRSIHESAVIIASKQSSSLLPMLISRVSDPKLFNQFDSEGFAAIHYCSRLGNLQGVKALLSADATVDLKDRKSGRTALFHAIDNGHKLVMQALLRAGAVATIANYAGQTPLTILNDMKMSFKMSLEGNTT
ncbi:uncharacterized protein LOC105207914 isoform X3 [Solenopsis invicta]|uniref:uncharacterized protein LOC105207914 isoform X3 n=1 Tax=Solenopsis invicta TaxID=13686 RepID=UPI000E33ED3A|nr:uncharacterized protein LOC105207914 isoform X3 [Solenopsis invicta]